MFQLDELLKLKPNSKQIDHMNALPNDRIGSTPYVIVKTIHRSNDAFVYLVRHSVTDQLFVVKEFYPMVDFEHMSVPMRVNRKNGKDVVLENDTVESLRVFTNLKKYYKEAAIYIKKMKNNHLPQVIDQFEVNNTVYIVLEYLPYPTLDELMTAKPMMIKQVMGLYQMILNGVSQIHQEGYVIKSLSPNNIYISDKRVIFGDFNPLKRSYFISGNTNNKYVAPEIVSGEILSEATDCYSLGRILEYLMGHVGYYQGTKIDGDRNFKPAVVDYLMKALTEETASDRIQSVDEIKSLLNHKIVNKSKRIEVLKIFAACFLVIIAIASVRKSGLIDMIPWPENVEEVVETEEITAQVKYYDFVTKRDNFDFSETKIIRWFDRTSEGKYYISIIGDETFEIVTSNQYFDFTGFYFNPGHYQFCVKNSSGDLIEMALEVNEDPRTHDISEPLIELNHFAYDLGQTYTVNWQAHGMTRLVVTDLKDGQIVLDMKTDQMSINLGDLELKKGNFLMNLQSINEDAYSLFKAVYVDVYDEGEIKDPIVYLEQDMKKGDYIHWAPLDEGDINVKFVHESGKTYEKFCPAAEGGLLLDEGFLQGHYELYMTYTLNEFSSKVVNMDFNLVD